MHTMYVHSQHDNVIRIILITLFERLSRFSGLHTDVPLHSNPTYPLSYSVNALQKINSLQIAVRHWFSQHGISGVCFSKMMSRINSWWTRKTYNREQSVEDIWWREGNHWLEEPQHQWRDKCRIMWPSCTVIEDFLCTVCVSWRLKG